MGWFDNKLVSERELEALTPLAVSISPDDPFQIGEAVELSIYEGDPNGVLQHRIVGRIFAIKTTGAGITQYDVAVKLEGTTVYAVIQNYHGPLKRHLEPSTSSLTTHKPMGASLKLVK